MEKGKPLIVVLQHIILADGGGARVCVRSSRRVYRGTASDAAMLGDSLADQRSPVKFVTLLRKPPAPAEYLILI